MKQYIAILRDKDNHLVQVFGPYSTAGAAQAGIDRLSLWPALKKGGSWSVEPMYPDPDVPATTSYTASNARVFQFTSPQYLPYVYYGNVTRSYAPTVTITRSV